MHLQIINTSDGSHSIYVKELNEHYHSIHGAIQESKHVFINAGLNKIVATSGKNNISILEIGLGTGLNALLTFVECRQLPIKMMNYTAVEAFPVNIELAEQLNYAEQLGKKSEQTVFEKIHTCEWEQPVQLSSRFSFYKIKNTLQNYIFSGTYNLIYFDAFGPAVQPEMWTEEVFLKLYAALCANGILVTYCAKGEVKRTLKKVGFTVESLSGPPGKREMVRAIKEIIRAR